MVILWLLFCILEQIVGVIFHKALRRGQEVAFHGCVQHLITALRLKLEWDDFPLHKIQNDNTEQSISLTAAKGNEMQSTNCNPTITEALYQAARVNRVHDAQEKLQEVSIER